MAGSRPAMTVGSMSRYQRALELVSVADAGAGFGAPRKASFVMAGAGPPPTVFVVAGTTARRRGSSGSGAGNHPPRHPGYAVRSLSRPSAACAAARRATGTRNGLHDT